jgi:hypothetical protein
MWQQQGNLVVYERARLIVVKSNCEPTIADGRDGSYPALMAGNIPMDQDAIAREEDFPSTHLGSINSHIRSGVTIKRGVVHGRGKETAIMIALSERGGHSTQE